MSKQRYPEEFKTEAVKQITERGHKVADYPPDLVNRPGFELPPRSWTNLKGSNEEVQAGVLNARRLAS